MKTLEDYNLIRDFLGSQGITPTAAMLCVQEQEWADLIYLAKSWKRELDERIAKDADEIKGLSEDELRQMDKATEEARIKQQNAVLFHSCGTEPE